jgi:hypothetical protein
MVYLALVSSIVISFELSPLSNEFPNEFLLIGIFFLRIASLQLFCVCLLLLARRHVLLFMVFLCCYLQRCDDLNYNNVVGDGFFCF